MIPVYCIEEHNEAFYCWGLAIRDGVLEAEKNLLFHVDHHDDLECGSYFIDFTRRIEDLEERKRITYEKLGIADFIIPAIYEGIFSEIYNMKRLGSGPFTHQEKVIKRIGSNTLSTADYVPFIHAPLRKKENGEYCFFRYHEGGMDNTGRLKRVALDIDLDYFCWDDSLRTAGLKRMEITREAYLEYLDNPYHPFRILPRRLLYAEEEKGRFYLSYQEPRSAEKEADEEAVIRRAGRFMEWLKEQDWTPGMITVCRSAHSGYLPSHKALLVEALVREGLEKLYELEWIENVYKI